MKAAIIPKIKDEPITHYDENRDSGEDEIGSFVDHYEKEKDDFIQVKIKNILKNKESYLNKIVYNVEDDYVKSLKLVEVDKNVYNLITTKVRLNEKAIVKKTLPMTFLCTLLCILLYFYLFPKTDYILFSSILLLFPFSFFNLYTMFYKSMLKKDKYEKLFLTVANSNIVINLFYEEFMSKTILNGEQMRLLKKIISMNDYKQILYKSGGPEVKYKYALPIVLKCRLEKKNKICDNLITEYYQSI